jgi:adenylate kinase
MQRIFILILFFVQTAFARTHFVLISAPGSGKGTFSQYLVRKYGYVQICPGDIFRDHIRAKTPLGRHIKPILERGEYVDEEIVFELMAQKLTEAFCAGASVIIDGFPRTHDSFDFLERYFYEHACGDTIIFLQFVVADDVCVERIVHRLICPCCAAVFRTDDFRDSDNRLCTYCTSLLTNRSADTYDIAWSRTAYFHECIEPLLERAAKHYLVRKISTECAYEELEKIYDALIEE